MLGIENFPIEPVAETEGASNAFDPIPAFAETAELEMAPTMEVQALMIDQVFDEMPELQYENWVNLDLSERVEALNEFEAQIAAIAHRPAIEVHAEDMEDNLRGYFNGTGVYINDDLVSSNTPEAYRSTIQNLLHEGRHAYQDYNIYVQEVEPISTMVDAWRINLEELGYESGDYLFFKDIGYMRYYTQPVEVDARMFAETALNAMGI